MSVVEPSRRAESFNRTMRQPAYPPTPPTEQTEPAAFPPLLPRTPPAAAAPDVATPRPPRNRPNPWLVAALVVALLSLLVSLFTYFDQRNRTEALEEELARANERIEALETQPDEGTDLEQLLEDLFGDLFSEGSLPVPENDASNPFGNLQLLECLTPEGALAGADPVEGTAPEQVDEIGDLVAADRALEFVDGEPPVTFLDPAQTSERILILDAEDYTADEAALDARLLGLLGAIEPGTDLRALHRELLSGQVAGFYEPESGELVVRSDTPGQPLGPIEQLTVAHELEHALADQNHELLDADLEADGADSALAALALIEGDASLAGQRFAVAHLSLSDQIDLSLSPEVAGAQEQLDAAPHYVARQLLFPYEEGIQFVCDRFVQGGWDGVDSLYDSPPRSTVEILFPDRYGEEPEEPREVPDPENGWEELRRGTLGAADLMFLFEAPGDDESRALTDPRSAVAAWAGGEYVLYGDGDESAVGVSLEALNGQEEVLCAAVEDFVDAAQLVDAAVRCEGTSIRLGIGPDPSTAQILVG
jgi:hypothetical protein